MVAVDAQLAMLAAQCMLSLVAIPPPASAIVIRSPHSNHGEVAGALHHHQRPVIPPPAKKEDHSSKGSHDLKPAKHKKHERSTILEESTDLTDRSSLSKPANAVPEQLREQRSFQTRDSSSQDAIGSILKPLLEQVLGALKPILGKLPGVDSVIKALRPTLESILNPLLGDAVALEARYHHDHYDHHHLEKTIIYEDSKPGREHIHEHIYARTHLERIQFGNGEKGKRGLCPMQGVIAAVSKDSVAYLSADENLSELNASPDVATLFCLDRVPWLPPSTQTTSNPVKLRVQQASDDGAGRCTTYDPNPSLPSPLTLATCFNSAENATEHKNQVFSLNPISNQLQPMSSSNTPAHQSVGMSTRDDAGFPGDAILVFKQSPVVAAAALPPSSDTGAQASVTTVTVTTTATQTGPSFFAAAPDTTTSTDSDSSSSPSSTSQSSPASFDVEVALPSATASSTESSENNVVSSTSIPSSTDSASMIASGSTAAEVSPSPASLLVQLKDKQDTVSGPTTV